jgi:hypothetical protein
MLPHRTLPGLEWQILRQLPQLLLAGTVPLAFAAFLAGDAFVEIVALGVALAYWMSLLALSVGCLIVTVMKGPRRTADSYSLPQDS